MSVELLRGAVAAVASTCQPLHEGLIELLLLLPRHRNNAIHRSFMPRFQVEQSCVWQALTYLPRLRFIKLESPHMNDDDPGRGEQGLGNCSCTYAPPMLSRKVG